MRRSGMPWLQGKRGARRGGMQITVVDGGWGPRDNLNATHEIQLLRYWARFIRRKASDLRILTESGVGYRLIADEGNSFQAS
jgi:hypothetical protein